MGCLPLKSNRDRLTFLANDGHHGSYRHLLTRLNQDLLDHATCEHLNVNRRLVRVHFSDDFAARHTVPYFLAPGDQCASAHVGPERGHDKLSHEFQRLPARLS